MKDPHLSGIAKALAAHGRKGDTELIHVSKKELDTLEKYGSGLGVHLTKNPATGLPEAFNWGGMLGSVGVPLAVLAATAATGGTAAPLLLAAAGAAGGAGGTLLTGGSTDQALMSGLMGGIGGFGMGGVAEGLAAAGTAATEQAATQAVEQGAAQAVEQGATDAAAQSAAQTLGEQSAQQSLQSMNALNLQSAAPTMAEGMTPAAGTVVNGSFVPTQATAPVLQSTPQTGMQLMGKGWDAVSASPKALGSFAMDNAKNIGMTGIGALGAGTSMNPAEQTISTEDTSNPYSGEMYMDPATGQMRSRAVRKASGGEIFGSYDGVETAADGGYIPGGGLNYADGGGVDSASSHESLGGLNTLVDLYDEAPDDNVVSGVNWTRAANLGPVRRQDGLAGGGGIGSLGSYSDGGRMLRGPGDGVSDSIPASIEGKRPARLADGEFVIPARAVSELGNGSTEAGSKQLYAMLDRIASKRKKGKGLAYEANPKKLMPA